MNQIGESLLIHLVEFVLPDVIQAGRFKPLQHAVRCKVIPHSFVSDVGGNAPEPEDDCNPRLRFCRARLHEKPAEKSIPITIPTTTDRKMMTASEDSKRHTKNETPAGAAFCTEKRTTAARTAIARTRNTIHASFNPKESIQTHSTAKKA
jgi:hypothetical protein